MTSIDLKAEKIKNYRLKLKDIYLISPFLISAGIIIFLFSLIYYGYWRLIALYLIFIYLDPRTYYGLNVSNPFRNLMIFKAIRDYFQMRIVSEGELNPIKNYVFCYHPHSIIPWGMLTALNSNVCGFDSKFPGIKLHPMVHSAIMQFPLIRELFFLIGVNPVTLKSIKRTLSQGPGHSALICIGGGAEIFYAKPGINKLVLKNRMGFIRMALETGSDLVPIFGFGENETYNQIYNGTDTLDFKLRSRIYNWLGAWVPLFYGRGVFPNSLGLFPNKVPITIIVGKSIEVKKITNPTKEEIRNLHEKYCNALKDLYDRNIESYWYDTNTPPPKLEIVGNPFKTLTK